MTNANLYNIGAVLEFKKAHPCGSKQWKVIKTGVDYKLECLGCQRVIIIPRVELKKKVKKVLEEPSK
jgi:hypothetical protein